MSLVSPIRLLLTTLLALVAWAAVGSTPVLAVVLGSGQNKSRAAEDGSYPWTVAILERDGSPQSQFCGGTIIDERRVLTAAHCIDPGGPNQATPDAIDVLVGQTSLVAAGCVPSAQSPCAADTEFRRGVRLRVADISLHSKTDILQVGSELDHFYYDVAVLTLAEPVPSRSMIVQPVASSGESTAETTGAPDAWGAASSTRRGVNTFVSGWGLTAEGARIAPNVMRFGGGSSMERLADVTCSERYPGEFRAEDMLCVGVANPNDPAGVDACQGDSGGPLIKRVESPGFQAKTATEANEWAQERFTAMTGPEITAAVQQDAAATGVDRVPTGTVELWRSQIRAEVTEATAQLTAWESELRAALTAEERSLPDSQQDELVQTRLAARVEQVIATKTDERILVGTASGYGSLYLQDRKAQIAAQLAAYAREGGLWRLVGVVSWGEGCGRVLKPGVYARAGAPAIRDYITSPAPAPMPRLASAGRPHVVGSYVLGQTVACQPGDWIGAADFSYAMWRDSDGNGSRSADDRTLTTTRAEYRLTTADVTSLRQADVDRGSVGIGCTVRARGQGGYATVSGAVSQVPLETAGLVFPEAPTPGPAPTPAPGVDHAAPLLSKKAAVCSTTSCRVSVIAIDAGVPVTGVRTVAAFLSIGRKSTCRVKSGKTKGTRRACLKTTAKTLKAARKGDEWVVKLRGLRKRDKIGLRFKGTDHAGNSASLTVPVKLRPGR